MPSRNPSAVCPTEVAFLYSGNRGRFSVGELDPNASTEDLCEAFGASDSNSRLTKAAKVALRRAVRIRLQSPDLARWYAQHADEEASLLRKRWTSIATEAYRIAFGEEPSSPGDLYRVSGIGRAEFPQCAKETLRAISHRIDALGSVAWGARKAFGLASQDPEEPSHRINVRKKAFASGAFPIGPAPAVLPSIL